MTTSSGNRVRNFCVQYWAMTLRFAPFQTLLNELGLFVIWNNGHRKICGGKLWRCWYIFRNSREQEPQIENAVWSKDFKEIFRKLRRDRRLREYCYIVCVIQRELLVSSEFYIHEARTIDHSIAALTRKILCLALELKCFQTVI